MIGHKSLCDCFLCYTNLLDGLLVKGVITKEEYAEKRFAYGAGKKTSINYYSTLTGDPVPFPFDFKDLEDAATRPFCRSAWKRPSIGNVPFAVDTKVINEATDRPITGVWPQMLIDASLGNINASSEDMDVLKELVDYQRKVYQSQKEAQAKEILQKYDFTSEQVKDILTLLELMSKK